MHRERVTFAFPAPRPTDWASTLCLLPIASQWAKAWNMEDISIRRIVYAHDALSKEQTGRTPSSYGGRNRPHNTHPFNEDGCIAVLIEGWASKE